MAESRSREHHELPLLLRWGAAVLSVAGAWLANETIPNGLSPAPFYIAAVMIAAHVGGSGPGLLSFALASTLLDLPRSALSTLLDPPRAAPFPAPSHRALWSRGIVAERWYRRC